MTANNKHKLKFIHLVSILQDETDSQRGLSMPEIIERLAARGISAERKSIYRDIAALRDAGIQIETLSKRPVEYVLARKNLDFDDVMMLVDIVQSSRFITERQSSQMVKRLKSLVSERERKLLNKRVHVQGRVKSQSGAVFHNVDTIHDALQRKRKVEFLYFSYDVNLKRRARHEGKRYVLTPVKVAYANDNYYLAAYDDADATIKTYRVDRMELLQVSDAPAVRNEVIAAYDSQDFACHSFGMFHGDRECVTLHVQAPMMDTMVDRFGNGMEVVKTDSNAADIRVNVLVSPQFYGWVAGLDGQATIKAPASVKRSYKEWLHSLIEA